MPVTKEIQAFSAGDNREIALSVPFDSLIAIVCPERAHLNSIILYNTQHGQAEKSLGKGLGSN